MNSRQILKVCKLILKEKWFYVPVLIFAVFWIVMFFIVPRNLFPAESSTLLYSSDGRLLGARIAPDGQWRFPATEAIPEKFVKCLVTYEDKRFYYHPGIDPLAMLRAVRLNMQSGEKTSGGSTLTMQLARQSRGNKSRTVFQKMTEIFWAAFIETTHRKRTILNLYASNAPFGGNVVGVETAAWRYFGRSASELSWAESATLAVLPNSPALIHPGRNRDQLKAKRDKLLETLKNRGIIDQTEYELSCMENLPGAPLPLPDAAPHLLDRLAAETGEKRLVSSVKYPVQVRVQEIVDHYSRIYRSNHVYNMAAIVADTETGETIAYVGNSNIRQNDGHGGQVDIITARRSTGSILKPFLYSAMLDDGQILPSTLIPDTPLNINGFSPQNYNKTFYGAVPAHRAIERSLNVPLVRMLSMYNTARFMELLKALGMTTLDYSEEHYGASIILGGAEGTLWDMAGIYASCARILSHYRQYGNKYDPRDIHPLSVIPVEKKEHGKFSERPKILSAASLWFAFEAMSALNRPEEEADWQQFESMKKIAWKTGTSWGGRDAWAIGVTPRFVVGVWVGNASGEGRPGVTGVANAAPVMFDIFSTLPAGKWFEAPLDEMVRTAVCRHSGYKASPICEHADTVYIPISGQVTTVCPYHRLIHLSPDERFRVNSSCESVDNMIARPWFVLPPAQEFYYRNYNVDYRPLPPMKPGCGEGSGYSIELIYPEHNAVLYLPKGFSGEKEKFIFNAAHSHPEATIFWHLDDQYVGKTTNPHQIALETDAGQHMLTIVDNHGNARKILFIVKSR